MVSAIKKDKTEKFPSKTLFERRLKRFESLLQKRYLKEVTIYWNPWFPGTTSPLQIKQALLDQYLEKN